MLAIAAVAVNVPDVMRGDGGGVGFAIGYVVLRTLLIALYVRAHHDVPGPGRNLSEVYIAGYGATTGVWLLSIFIPAPFRYVLWGVAMVVDLVIPVRAWALLRERTVAVSHLTERFGTFFIIVLGQSFIAVVGGVAGLEFTLQSWIVGAACVVTTLCLWWIYFDLADTSVVGRGVLGLVYVYSHFPLLVGVSAFGVGAKLAITEAGQPGLTAGARWALAGGIAAFALALAVIHVGAEWTSMHDRTFIGRILLAALAISLAAAAGAISPLAFVVLLAAGVFAQLMLEAFTARVGAATVIEPRSEALAAPIA
jgi:low temperature requirement protein LtrA